MVYASPRPSAPGTGKWRCHYCGHKRKHMTNDHVVPRALGGSDDPRNFVRACAPCNTAKRHTLPTCRCETCVAAILYHWQHIAEMPEGYRAGLTAKVAGLPTPAELASHAAS